jgi:predicted ATPase
VLVLDDLQWADLGSINLLFHLGRHLSGFRILILGAYRSEEITLGREGGRHPLLPVINELQRQYGDISVNVDQAEPRPFLEALLDSEPNKLGPQFREMLHRQTRGHPMFTVELLRDMQDRGDLVQDQDGLWVEGHSLDWNTMPARVEAVIAERIGRLDEPLRSALRVASVEGETFTAEVIARVCVLDEQELLGRMSRELDKRHQLIRAQSIQRIDGQLLSSYRFRHIIFQKFLYSSLDEVERVHLHEQVGTTLEALYATQGDITPISLQLAQHFQEARITEKAVHYLHLAGERAVQMSAYQEALVHLTQGLALLMTLPDTPERAEKELKLQISLGMAWVGSSGYGPDAEKAYSSARQLCQQLGNNYQLSRVLGDLSVLHYVRAEHQQARELAEEALNLAKQTGDPILVAISSWSLGFILFALGEYTTSLEHHERVVAFYDPGKHHRSMIALRGSDAGPAALAYTACCLWCLGYPDQAQKYSQQAFTLARALGHPFTLCDVLSFAGCMVDVMRRDARTLKEHTDELVRLSNEKGLSGWMGTGISWLGEAMAMLSQYQEGIEQMRQGMTARESSFEKCYVTGNLRSMAEAQAKLGQMDEALDTLAQAFTRLEETGERHWEAELHRLKGELLLALDDPNGAEASFEKAIQIARRQHARSWELRSTISLARLWGKQGKIDEARGMLGEIYAWFTEGFDTPDLKDAKALLDELD